MENTEITIEDMAAQLGGATTATEEPVEPEVTEPVVVEETTTEPEPEPEPQQEGTPEVDLQAQKQQQAFIHMRQQTKRQAELLKNVASLLGIENPNLNDENQLMDALQQKVIANQAQQQNVPVEVLQKLQSLEEQNQQFLAAQRERDLAVGFQRVQEEYKLSQNELNKFAADLLASGRNPLVDDIDVVREYKIMHMDDLIERAKNDAIAQEQARAVKASGQATVPSKTTGTRSGDGVERVNSVRELENWFKQNI